LRIKILVHLDVTANRHGAVHPAERSTLRWGSPPPGQPVKQTVLTHRHHQQTK